MEHFLFGELRMFHSFHICKKRGLPEETDLSKVPSAYHDLAPVFNKQRALFLPRQRPYDCSIDLLPGAPLPASTLYDLSGPESESMREYSEESLNSGIIHPSTAPVGAGFVFVAKKMSLPPFINYRGFNQIMVKKKKNNLLPLTDSLYEQLHSATIFSKLDLQNDYHLVRGREEDEWKTTF